MCEMNCNCTYLDDVRTSVDAHVNIFKEIVRECTYVINDEKRTVTAILTNTSLDAVKAVRSNLGGIDVGLNIYGDVVNAEELNTLLIADKFVATVHCSPADVFDAETGIRKAKQRVYAKYDKARVKAWERYRAKLIAKENALVTCIEKYSK